MVEMCAMDLTKQDKFDKRYKILKLLGKLLSKEDIFPKGCDDLQNIIDAYNNGGYNALHNIRYALKNTVFLNVTKSKIPFQKKTMYFGTYIQLVDMYTKKEYLHGSSFSN